MSSLSVETQSNRIKNSEEFERELAKLGKTVDELEGEGKLSFNLVDY